MQVKKYAIKKYEASDYAIWNAFTGKAKNATFLFNRDFMDYHSDRFSDFSLLVFEAEKLVSVLPANHSGNTVFSHQGLTYGGIILGKNTKFEASLEIFAALLEYLDTNQKTILQIKPIPFIYADSISQETDYLLFAANAKLTRRDCLSVIDNSKPHQYSKRRERGVKQGVKNGLIVKETSDFSAFWNDILIPNLQEKHEVKPVHSLAEIELLHSEFPKNIRQFNVYHNENIVAGTTIFESENVAHCQYISGNTDKNILGSVDFLHDFLIANIFKDKKYFDFGISNENQGKNVNLGLLSWKESFGSILVNQDCYEIETHNFSQLRTTLL